MGKRLRQEWRSLVAFERLVMLGMGEVPSLGLYLLCKLANTCDISRI